MRYVERMMSRQVLRKAEIEEMGMTILALRKTAKGLTEHEALVKILEPEADGSMCKHCHDLFHAAWRWLIRKGYLEQVG